MIKFLAVNLTILLLLSELCSAQINPGAKQVALSHSTIASNPDVFALFSNTSALSRMNWREIGIYYSPAPFGLKELANAFGAYHEPTLIGSFSLGFSTYGFKLYRKNQFVLGYANQIYDKVYAGISLNYHMLSIERYGEANAFSINVSALALVQHNLRIGFSFDNITRSSIADEVSQLPVILSTGVSYDPLENIAVNFSIIKDLDRDESYNFGIEYFIIRFVTLRAGVSTEPTSFSAGLGINYSLFELDYATFNHQDLGFTHQVGLIIQFGGDKPRYQRFNEY